MHGGEKCFGSQILEGGMPDRVAIGFINGLGNFIFLTAAVKVLRKWNYEHIDLITDDSTRHYSMLLNMSKGIFNSVETFFDESKYERLFVCGWSVPNAVQPFLKKSGQGVRIIHWDREGIHEVQAYLNMIGASWNDFDGYMLEPADEPILECPHPRIALANPSLGQASKKKWNSFPELSDTLDALNFTVILLGNEDELKGC